MTDKGVSSTAGIILLLVLVLVVFAVGFTILHGTVIDSLDDPDTDSTVDFRERNG